MRCAAPYPLVVQVGRAASKPEHVAAGARCSTQPEPADIWHGFAEADLLPGTQKDATP